MLTMDFNEIATSHCALVDLGSVYDFCEPEVMGFLRGTSVEYKSLRQLARLRDERGLPAAVIKDEIRKNVQRDQSVMNALILLERVICYDYLVIDQVAFGVEEWQSRTESSLPREVFRSARFSDEVYARADQRIRENRKMLGILEERLPLGHAFHAGDKQAHDVLRDDPILGRYHFAASTDPLERTFFYLEVAKTTTRPVVLSPQKSGFLVDIREAADAEIHQRLSSLFDDAIKAEFDQCIAEFTPVTFSMPPLSDFLLRQSVENDTPLWYAALEIREQRHARQYREYLGKLQTMLQSGRSGAMELSKEVKELRNVAEDWAKSGDFGLHVTHERREIARIPGVGLLSALLHVADKAGLEELVDRLRESKPPDPILFNERPYLAFMADWYR